MNNNNSGTEEQFIVPVPESNRIYIDTPEGQHPAILFQIIDLGTQEQYNKTYDPKREVKFCFELPFQRHVFKEGEEPKPKIIFTFPYNFVISDGSNLKAFADSVLGRVLIPSEYAKGWNIMQLLNKEVLLNLIKVTNKKNPNEPHINIKGISPLTDYTKSTLNFDWTKMKLENDVMVFSIDPLYKCFTQPKWGELWDGYKKVIRKSEEYQAFIANGGVEYVKPEEVPHGEIPPLPPQNSNVKVAPEDLEDPKNFM